MAAKAPESKIRFAGLGPVIYPMPGLILDSPIG